jgi:hypothetical protein
MNHALGERRRGFRGIALPHANEGEQSLFHLARDLTFDADLGTANSLYDRAHLQDVLIHEASIVVCDTLGSHENELADADPRENSQWPVRDIAHFENLAVCDTRLHERRRHVNHQAESRESASSLQESTKIARQPNPLTCDAVNRAPRF